MTVFTNWLNDIKQNFETNREHGLFNDLSEMKTTYDKFNLLSSDIIQHAEMVLCCVLNSNNFTNHHNKINDLSEF